MAAKKVLGAAALALAAGGLIYGPRLLRPWLDNRELSAGIPDPPAELPPQAREPLGRQQQMVAPRLRPGRIVFQPSRTMQVSRAETVLVRLDAGASPNLWDGLDRSSFRADVVQVSPRMLVHLTGDPPDAFEIVASQPAGGQQAVSNLSASTWIWGVTPRKAGDAKLNLHISALAKVLGQDTLVPLLQKTETIHVHAAPLALDGHAFLDKALGKIAEKVGEEIAAGAALAAMFWLRRWWRRRQAGGKPGGRVTS